jgi:hypothetical protein
MGSQVAKAKIYITDETGSKKGEQYTFMYNPETLTLNESAGWGWEKKNGDAAKSLTYSGRETSDFSVQLLVDTTRDMLTPPVKAGQDVRKHITFLLSLLENTDDNKGRPPFCCFDWGGTRLSVVGVVKSLNVTYTLFMPEGTPVRAKVDLVIMQIKSPKNNFPPQNPTSRSEARKTYIVREGDRLDWIAYQEYGNSAHWRHIAETNGIDDPFNLRTGQVLKLTPLD